MLINYIQSRQSADPCVSSDANHGICHDGMMADGIMQQRVHQAVASEM